MSNMFICRKLFFVFPALVAFAMCADQPPTVELFTGWTWLPYSYYGRPYRDGYFPYGWGPSVGIAQPLYGYPYDPFLYGDPYGPSYWGWGYGVRYRLLPDRAFSSNPRPDYESLPGAAPTTLRTNESKIAWDDRLEAFLGGTNAPPAQAPRASPAPVPR